MITWSRRLDRQSGQVLVFFALALALLLGSVGLVTDLGYAFAEKREMKNGADLAAVAAAEYIGKNPGTADSNVNAIITDMIKLNVPLTPSTTWTAWYVVDGNGTDVSPPKQVGSGGTVPATALGVKIADNELSKRFFSRVLTAANLNIMVKSTAIVTTNPNQGGVIPPFNPGIVSLDPSNWHTVYSGGHGSFNVYGNIIVDSCNNSPAGPSNWGSGATPPCRSWNSDTIDARDTSVMHVRLTGAGTGDGTIITTSGGALDNGFSGNIHSTWAYRPDQNTYIYFDGGLRQSQPYFTDWLQFINTPVTASTACPGSSAVTRAGGTYTSLPGPGVYGPGKVTLNVTADTTVPDCGGGNPGIYIFQGGLIIRISSGKTLTANNVMFYSKGSIDPTTLAAPFTGSYDSGCPWSDVTGSITVSQCKSRTAIAINRGDANSNNCESGIDCSWALFDGARFGGTSVSTYGFLIGGAGTMTMTPPTAGPYRNVALFQDRSTVANIGFNVVSRDSATINITGVAYGHNANNTPWCTSNCEQTGIALVSGFEGCTISVSACNVIVQPGGGSVNIQGAAVVDAYITTGNVTTTITFDATHIPTIGGKLTQ